MEKISVIIPIYNVEKYLKKCVYSVINQSYKNLEIILVDDESPDNCPKICEELKQEDNRIVVIHQRNKGLSGARNAGMKIASGEYLVFHDSDDTIDQNCINELYNCLKKHDTLISVCGKKYEFENGKIISKYNEIFEKCYNFEDAMAEMNKFYYFDMSACGKLYHKSLFKNIKFPVGKLSEDYYVMYKIFKQANKIAYTSKQMYNYLQRQNSISKNKKINEEFIDAAYNQMKDLENYSERMKKIVHVAYASANLTVFNLYLKQKVKCPKNKIKQYKTAVKENLHYINSYNELPKVKKIQFKLFLLNKWLYILSFKLYKKKNLV